MPCLQLCNSQLYKAVEVGYCMGLESLNENLPEIKAELVFTQKQLQVRGGHGLSVCIYPSPCPL